LKKKLPINTGKGTIRPLHWRVNVSRNDFSEIFNRWDDNGGQSHAQYFIYDIFTRPNYNLFASNQWVQKLAHKMKDSWGYWLACSEGQVWWQFWSERREDVRKDGSESEGNGLEGRIPLELTKVRGREMTKPSSARGEMKMWHWRPKIG
jgi:hypothetical protein